MIQPFERLIGAKIRQSFNGKAELLSLKPLAGDASSRRYYRAVLSGSHTPRSIVVMEIPPGGALPLSSEELAVFKEPLREIPFLNVHRFLTRIGVRVPRLYGQWKDEGILLLEDLGDIALWDHAQGIAESEVLTWYRKAIDELLLLQIRGTEKRDESCIAFQQRFDFRLYMWEFDHFIEYGLVKRPGGHVSATTTEALRRTFEKIARRLDRQPPCLNHRDYHSWNLMIHDDAIAVIDFQDALLAPRQYDLASLLNDRETDQIISPPLEQELIRYYLEKRQELGEAQVSRDEFLEIYLLSAIQRDLKVVGRFYYLDLVKGKPGYKKFIPATLRRLKRNIAQLPHLNDIGSTLAEHYEEMR